MSSIKATKQEKIDGIGMIVGFIVITVLIRMTYFWSDQSEQFYRDNSDLVPGTYLMFGLVFLFPVLLYGIALFMKGIWTILSIFGRGYIESSTTSSP